MTGRSLAVVCLVLVSGAMAVRAAEVPAAEPAGIVSPDDRVAVAFVLQVGGTPAWRITYAGRPVLLESRLGLLPGLLEGFSVVGTSAAAHSGQWTQVYGERKIVPDNYRQLQVDLRHSSGRLLRLVFRAYDEGAAMRYELPEQPGGPFDFTGERTEFRFPPRTFGYEEHGTEGEYRRAAVEDIQPWCERPLTLEYDAGFVAGLTEADNRAYPRMLLSPAPGGPGTLISALGGPTSNTERGGTNNPNFTLAAGQQTPWRVLLLGERPGDLLERNYLILNLCPPCALADTSWIKPGKAMRDTRLTTANCKAIADFAATAGLQYMAPDARWYGSADAATGDATLARVPDFDLPEIIRYGREKGVGLILYVDRRQMTRQRETLLPLYRQWGVQGIKLGFVEVGSQANQVALTRTIELAAEHRLMLNIHDGYRPTGLSRTWPNLMTVEGIRGNEQFPTAEHNTTLPFTRFLAGPGDYTICYLDGRLKTTHAHQMALAVVYYSPLTWLYWYDRPEQYRGEPELQFFAKVPTVWDETRVLHDRIGQFATIARRSGEQWFLGTINNSEARRLEVPLRFLNAGRLYTAHIYRDSDAAPTRTKVGIEVRPVNSASVLELDLKPGGGQAVWIEPARVP